MESLMGSVAGMLLALGAVIALAWFVLKLMRNRMQPGVGLTGKATEDALRFVRALPVGAKERVVIVEHRGERWMLGVTAGAINTIAHWPTTATGMAGDRGAATLKH
jgi:flagellar protein FliO/FliZ